ncbi:LytR/AlgR family response regulator transcription factor [Catenovulum sp. SX2]|uniref:LytR/AlgR family response regulator transcription factor n=1 Tax=Catenovulum sp. SX2 TaxID=3398614 RepID=UPI003F86840B
MPSITAVIAEDEPLLLEELSAKLQQHSQIDIVAKCTNGVAAVKAIQTHNPQLVFLDIMMPGLSGLEVVSKLQADVLPEIIFVTAYDNFAVKAFELAAVDYLLKPISSERLAQAIDKAEQKLAQQQANSKQKYLAASSEIQQTLLNIDNQTQLPSSDIMWVDAAGDYMCIHTQTDTHVMRCTLKGLQKILPEQDFIRVHRSTLVNVNYVQSVQALGKGDFNLNLADASQIRMSRSYAQNYPNLADN